MQNLIKILIFCPHFPSLKMFSGKWERNIRILIKVYIFWFYPSSFWLSYSSSSSMPKIIYPNNFVELSYEIWIKKIDDYQKFIEFTYVSGQLPSRKIASRLGLRFGLGLGLGGQFSSEAIVLEPLHINYNIYNIKGIYVYIYIH